MIGKRAHEFAVRVDPNPRITACVLFGNGKCGVLASIIDNDVLPVSVGLAEDAFNALAQIGLTVVNGSKYAHQGLIGIVHLIAESVR